MSGVKGPSSSDQERVQEVEKQADVGEFEPELGQKHSVQQAEAG